MVCAVATICQCIICHDELISFKKNRCFCTFLYKKNIVLKTGIDKLNGVVEDTSMS